jgi:hypothetical protein
MVDTGGVATPTVKPARPRAPMARVRRRILILDNREELGLRKRECVWRKKRSEVYGRKVVDIEPRVFAGGRCARVAVAFTCQLAIIGKGIE